MNFYKHIRFFTTPLLLVLLLGLGCSENEKEKPTSTPTATTASVEKSDTQFRLLSHQQTGIQFANMIKEDEQFNYFTYSYMFNGGGVATADLDGDGLPEVIFAGNQEDDLLYQNNGNLNFTDVTKAAGLTHTQGFSHGVSIVDINQDGMLDIYICRSGPFIDAGRKNLLYVNQGNLKFKEEAAAYGLDDTGYSKQAYFFDYDKDGDLDMYLVNHRVDFEHTSMAKFKAKIANDAPDSDHFYKNNGNGTFTNISNEVGISNFTWGLSASVGDFNDDGWDDIFVSNDFLEADHLFINQKNGRFKDEIKEHMGHTSMFSMGSDFADINNDSKEDLLVLDMISEDHVRSKMLMGAMSTEDFWTLVNSGIHFQFMTNTLQLNQGNGQYSEIGQLAGISKTDWSWSVLFTDFDNDSYQDIFITNGIKKDMTDNDYKIRARNAISEKGRRLTLDELDQIIPRTKLKNYMFHNQGNLHFEKVQDKWGLTQSFNSTGASIADLDADGDMDIIVNNTDEKAAVFENVSKRNKHYLQVKLKGDAPNIDAFGARVTLAHKGSKQDRVLRTSRGYLSSQEPILHFGLGNESSVDSLVVTWPDGKQSLLQNVKADQTLSISKDQNPTRVNFSESAAAVAFEDVSQQLKFHQFPHQENVYDDFIKELLLPHKQSEHGPKITTGDANGDGLDDYYLGGAAGQAGKLWLQHKNGYFYNSRSQPWAQDKNSEDLGGLFFDADGDGDQDLYVVSGGNEYEANDPALQDRFYRNEGNGVFKKDAAALPKMLSSGQQVVAGDIDNDGDMDLFVGGRIIPGKYPFNPRSFLLQNDGGKFTDITQTKGKSMDSPGLITDAVFTDYDGDGDQDLIAVGEWTNIMFFNNRDGQFNKQIDTGIEKYIGWWYSIEQGDFDGDGDMDYAVGNLGKNNKFKATLEHPFHVYCADFDENGTNDIVLAKDKGNIKLPVRGRECSSEQMPFIKDKFPTYESFAKANLDEIYSDDRLQKALHKEATTFASAIIINEGNGKFSFHKLPNEAQMAPINDIIVKDLNQDGNLDLICAGNHYGAEVETVRYDAGKGACLLGDGKGGFKALPTSATGFYAQGNAKSLAWLEVGGTPHVFVGNNRGPMQGYKLK